MLQIIHKVCCSNDKIKSHLQNTLKACIKIIETDNEQCGMYSMMILKDLFSTYKPKFDGCYKTEVYLLNYDCFKL